MNHTSIEWTDATWNPIRGCSRVSEGCRHCYAEKIAYRFSGAGLPYEGLAMKVNGHASWTGKVAFVEAHLLDPLTDPDMREPVIEHKDRCLKTARLKDGKWESVCGCPARPRRIFVDSMSDLFHENVSDEWIDRIFAVMALCPQHQFQVLTKRPERMLKYLAGACGRIADLVVRMRRECGDKSIVVPLPHIALGHVRWPLANVWLGVSVENQAAADERVPVLLQTPAAVRFISAEPLLERLDLPWLGIEIAGSRWVERDGAPDSFKQAWASLMAGGPKLDWVIVGGESGPGARPMHPDWGRSLRDQCRGAVPFFFKQWGEWVPCGHLPPNHGIPAESVPPDRVRWVNADGRSAPIGNAGDLDLGPQNLVMRVGKKTAGALLDGREWREFPEARS